MSSGRHPRHSTKGSPKARSKPSWTEKLGGIGSTVSLLVSVALGIFTLYDRVVNQPIVDKEKSVQQLHSTVAAIGSLNLDATMKVMSIADPVDKQKYIGIANTQRALLLNDAETLTAKYPDTLGAGDYVTLSTAAFALGDGAHALDFLNTAVLRPTDPVTHAEIFRIRGETRAQVGGAGSLPAARQDYEEALKLMANITAFGASGLRANVLGSLVITSAWGGEGCGVVNNDLIRLVNELGKPNTDPTLVRVQKLRVKQSLTLQTRCKVDVSQLS